jgi:dUTP pyrophosphatase
MLTLKWKKLQFSAQIPAAATKGAACFDLVACFPESESYVVEHGSVCAVPTGLAVEIPQGYEMQIRARSGLAAKQGICLVNGIGTIDSDYRGELKILLTRLIPGNLTIRPGDRIAQALLSVVPEVQHLEVESLSSTERGQGGFGSTGVALRSPQETTK